MSIYYIRADGQATTLVGSFSDASASTSLSFATFNALLSIPANSIFKVSDKGGPYYTSDGCLNPSASGSILGFIYFEGFGSPEIIGDDWQECVKLSGLTYISIDGIDLSRIVASRCINIADASPASYLTIKNCGIDLGHTDSYGIMMDVTGGDVIHNVTIDNINIINGVNGNSDGIYMYSDSAGGYFHTINILNCTIDGAPYSGVRIICNAALQTSYNIRIDNVEVANCRNDGIYFNGLTNTTGMNYIGHCHVHDNGSGNVLGGINVSKVTGVLVENNQVHDNTTNGIDGNGIYFDWDEHFIGCDDFICRNNLVYGHTTNFNSAPSGETSMSSGIAVTNSNNGKIYNNIVFGNNCGINATAATVQGVNNIQIFNNTVVDNVYDGMRFGWNINSAEVDIYNNIVAHNGRYGIYNVSVSSNPTLDYNCFYSNGTANVYQMLHGSHDKINQNPSFVAIATHDYALLSSSPCIDSGTSIPINGMANFTTYNGLVITDSSGNMLLSYGDPDIGACCYNMWPSIDHPRSIKETYLKPANRSTSEFGYVVTRPMWISGIRSFELAWTEILTPDKDTLEEFFNYNQGIAFQWTHPELKTTHTCIFMDDELSFESAAFGYDTDGSPLGIWQLSMTIWEQQ